MTQPSEKNSSDFEPTPAVALGEGAVVVPPQEFQEEAPAPLHESWASQEEYERYLANLSTWKGKLIEETIVERDLIDEELANFETVVNHVEKKVAEAARTTGQEGRDESFFRRRVQFFEAEAKMKAAAAALRDNPRVAFDGPTKKKKAKNLGGLESLAELRGKVRVASEEEAPLSEVAQENVADPIEAPSTEGAQNAVGDAESVPDTVVAEPKHVDPPPAIEEVSAEVSQQEMVDRMRECFDVIARASKDFQRAQYELLGDKKEFNGLRKGLINLEARRTKLDASGEGPQKEKALQALNRDIADVERRKAYAEEVFTGARLALQENMREVVAHIDLLPSALAEAIRSAEDNAPDHDAIFRKYNISPVVAGVVSRALNKNKKEVQAPVVENNEVTSTEPRAEEVVLPSQNLSGIYEERDGHIFNAGTDEQLDRPIVVPKKGDDAGPTSLGSTTANLIPIVMSAEGGIVTHDQSLEPNPEQELLDKMLKAGQPKAVAYPPVSTEQNPALTGIYDTENLPNIAVDTPKEEKTVPTAPFKEKPLTALSWDELKDLYHGADPEAARAANAEWERRAFLIARKNGVEVALQNTLDALREINGGVIPEEWVPPPERWLREFQEIPIVANYLALHPLPASVVSPQPKETSWERIQEEKAKKQGNKMQTQLADMAARAGVERFSNRQLEEMHLDDNAFAPAGKDTTAEEQFEMDGEAYRAQLRRAMSAFITTPTLTFDEFKGVMGTGKKTTERLLDELALRGLVEKTTEGVYRWIDQSDSDALELPTPDQVDINAQEQNESKEGILSVGEVLSQVEQHIEKQPESVKKVLQEARETFCVARIIDGKTFLFTGLTQMSDSVLALVSDEQNPEIFHTRAFRFSGSDHQWKALPALRSGGGYTKGEESNPMHHYVQSAKLDKRVYLALDQLPAIDSGVTAEDFLPEKSREDGTGGKFTEEITFKEEYTSLKDENWAKKQKILQDLYRIYDYLVLQVDQRGKFAKDDDFHQWLGRAGATDTGFAELKTVLDEALAAHGNSLNGGLGYMMHNNESDPLLKKYAELHRKVVGEYFEKQFKSIQLHDMAPDFSGTPKDVYEKRDIYGKGKIMIEEFERVSDAGDRLVWAMAHDDKGRVYIDNIYDPSVGMSDYGIPRKITQMGILVYKPEDYLEQARAIPPQYVSDANGYKDISKFWELIGPVQRYKDSLNRREGEKKVETKELVGSGVTPPVATESVALNDIESMIGREPSELEDETMQRIFSLEAGTTDAATLEKIAGIKKELLDMMKKNRTPLLPAQITWTTRKL